jgi:uncharacterized delta-60 repeat protein
VGNKAILVASLALMVMVASRTALAAAGSLDPDFGNGGRVLTNFGHRSDDERAHDVAVQPDGKIVAVGDHKGNGGPEFAVARYSRDGALDGTFGGGDGKVTTSFSGYGIANALAIQPDGKIVVAGYGVDPSYGDFVLARYNPNGSLDGTFGGGDGKVTTNFGNRTFDEASTLIVQPDGKLVVAGSTSRVSDFETFYEAVALARYAADGTLDETFGGGDGKVRTDVGPGNDAARDLVLKPNGKLVVAGYTAKTTGRFAQTRFLMVRYGPKGRVDRGFGGNGKVTTDFGYDGGAYALVRQPDNKIVAAGYSVRIRGTDMKFALARYEADGKLDRDFGEDGRVFTPMGTDGAAAYDLARLPSGRLVAAGSYGIFALARYTPSGALDSSFGEGGRVLTKFRNEADAGEAVAAQGNGRVIVAGRSIFCDEVNEVCEDSFALVRYRGS